MDEQIKSKRLSRSVIFLQESLRTGTERIQNRYKNANGTGTEWVQNGYRTVIERKWNGYRTVTNHKNRRKRSKERKL